MGQDANWDLLNYHLYNGAALLQGRFGHDLLAAGMQSYLNPVLDAAYAGLALGPLRNHPRLLAAATGLWFAATLYFAVRLALLLYPRPLYPERTVPVLAGTLLGVSGAAVVSQIGTTTGELPAGAVMLGGLFLLLRGSAGGAPSARCVALAGLLFGLAAGLKLTAAAYAPAACLAAASLYRPSPYRASLHRASRMPVACAVFTAGWLAGFAVADGWWALQLYQRFQSPVFPLFNGVFRSPWYPPAGVIDDRFFPSGLLQWLFYPFYWIGGSASPSDLPFRDPRAAVALGLGILAALPWPGRPRLTPVQRATLIFLALGYAAWLASSSILRYAVVIEVVAGLAVPLLLARLLPARLLPARLPPGRALAGGLVVVLGIVLPATRYPASFRVPYGPETLRADVDWVEPGMLIVLTFRGPVAHIVPLMPHQASIAVMNVGDTVLEARGWPLHDAMLRRVRDHPGRIVVVTQGHPLGRFPELGEIGLDPALSNCRPVSTTFVPASQAGIHACDARRLEPAPMPSPFWAQAALRYRTLAQPPDAGQTLIGAAYLRAAGPPARGTRFIDWTDLLWSGVRHPAGTLPPRPDPDTLYVLAPEFALAMAARLDPAVDAIGRVDGVVVAAPGWRTCAACTAPLLPLRIGLDAPPLAIGATRRLGPEARPSGYLGDGWWPQEPSSVWSQGEAEMLIPIAADLPDRSTLVLKGTAFTGPGLPAQRVTAEAAGHPEAAASQSFAGEGVLRLPLRRAWLQPGPDGTLLLRLRLRFPDAASPTQLGVSTDPRRLGLSPASVGLEGE